MTVELVTAWDAGSSALTWTLSLPFRPESVPMGRHQLIQILRDEDLPTSVIDDACVVLTELLGNAVRHARPLPDGHIVVSVSLESEVVGLAVTDGGGATVPSLVSPVPMAASGRGLGIVHSLTRDWGVQESAGGNTVFGILSRV